MKKQGTLAAYGAKREKVRVYVEVDLVRVRWRLNGRRLTKSYPDTSANRALAKAFAQGIVEERERPQQPVPLTLRGLWDKFADAEFPHLRPRSRALYAEYWRRWEAMWGRDFNVEKTTLDMAHQFRKALGNLKLSTSTIGQTIRTAQMIYRWGQKNELVTVNKLALYEFKVSKEDRTESPAEYRNDDFAKMLAALDPNDSDQWRAYVALAICGAQGARQNAVLHLQWADVDASRIRWRSQWDKLGRDWSQPLRALTIRALDCATMWRNRSGYKGDWILPAGSTKNKGATYTAQSLWSALKGAEKRADIQHIKGRGAHGLRRLLAGNVAALTGDATLAMASIGDTDVRMASRYLKKREDRIEDAFRQLDVPESGNAMATEAEGAE